MKPYQVNLFKDEDQGLDFPPRESIFFVGDKRYLNFLNFDCLSLKNSEDLREAVKSSIEAKGLGSTEDQFELMTNLQKMLFEIKRLESILVFPDEISALYALFSITGPQTTFFVDYETTPSIVATLQNRHIEYYNHHELEQLSGRLAAISGKVLIIDGLYEWLGSISPINNLIRIAKDNECIIVANELNSFGLLGRDGRGFVDLGNCYDEVNIEIGSFSKFLGGFGCYIGAKKFLVNKIRGNISNIIEPMPQHMLSLNLAALEPIKLGKLNKDRAEKLWKNSRYFISRLNQFGFKTPSETPLVVVLFTNDEEAEEFSRRLFAAQVLVASNKERIRVCISVEHSKPDLDEVLSKFEAIGKELGIIH